MKKIQIILIVISSVTILALFIYSFFSNKFGTPAEWLSGLGSLLAVIVSLYLANRVEAPSIDFEVKSSVNGEYAIKIRNNARYFVRLEVLNISSKYIRVAGYDYNKDIGIPLGPCGSMLLGDDYSKHKPKSIVKIAISQEIEEKKVILLDRISKKKFKINLD